MIDEKLRYNSGTLTYNKNGDSALAKPITTLVAAECKKLNRASKEPDVIAMIGEKLRCRPRPAPTSSTSKYPA